MPRLEPEIIERRIEAMRIRRAEIIKERGWFVQGVFSTDERPILWNYTIGMLPKFGFELIVFGLRLEHAGPIFNELGEDFKKGELPVMDKPLSASRWFHGDMFIMFKDCLPKQVLYDEWIAAGANYHGCDGFPVKQIVMCDENGKFPGEPGYDKQTMDAIQPLLYVE